MSEDDKKTLNIDISGPAGSHRLGTALTVANLLRGHGVEVTFTDPDGDFSSEGGAHAQARFNVAGPNLRAVITTRQTPREPTSEPLAMASRLTASFSETAATHGFKVTSTSTLFSFKDDQGDEVNVPLEHARKVAEILLGAGWPQFVVVDVSDLHALESAAINAERKRQAADQAREAATNVDKEARAAEKAAEDAVAKLEAARFRVINGKVAP